MNILAGREIHHRVGAPSRGPDHLLHFFLDRRGDRRVADVRIHLHVKIAADDHRLDFRVIDVARNNRPAGRHLLAHELRCDVLRSMGAEAHPRVLLRRRVCLAVDRDAVRQRQILADRDVLHFRRDDALPSVVQLRDVGAVDRPARCMRSPEAQAIQRPVGGTLVRIPRAEVVQLHRIVPLLDPANAVTS